MKRYPRPRRKRNRTNGGPGRTSVPGAMRAGLGRC
jgi:hypothetical protein